MITKLGDAAQLLKDDYYQGYAPQDAFFDLEHFMLKIASVYARMVNDEFLRIKRQAKAETGFGYGEVAASWSVHDTLDVVSEGGCHRAVLPCAVFGFDWDSYGCGVQSACPVKGDPASMIRISPSEEWMFGNGVMPHTAKTFYFTRMSAPAGDMCATETEIILLGGNVPDKIKVFFVPALDPENKDSPIAASKANQIVAHLLQEQLIAKKEIVVDKTNDFNENATPATEINADSVPRK